MDDRVAMAISHWAPRFTTNGVTAGDFERITSGLATWDDWCAGWSQVAAEHEAALARLHGDPSLREAIHIVVELRFLEAGGDAMPACVRRAAFAART